MGEKLDNFKYYFLGTICVASIFLVNLNLELNVAGGIPYLVVIMVSLGASTRLPTLVFAGVCTFFTLLGPFFSSPGTAAYYTALTNCFLTLFAIWITAALGFLLKEKEFELRKSNELLEKRVEERTAKLRDSARQLELEKLKLEQVLGIEEGLGKIVQLNALVDYVVQKVAEVLDAQKCSLVFVDRDVNQFCIRSHIGLDGQFVKSNEKINQKSFDGIVVSSGNPLLIRDIEIDGNLRRKNRRRYKSKSFMIVPIKLNETIVGVINVTDKNSEGGGDDIFTAVDLKILQLIASNVAVAIENCKLYRELEYLTLHDPMTNMYNFRHFTKSLDLEVKRSKRYSRSLCLLMIDVDDFKSYNDDYGHPAGDELLRNIGRILKENLREVDTGCRYAGDEFVAILPEVTLCDAEIVAEKIKKKVADLSLNRGVTVSIGVGMFSSHMNRHDLIQKVDTALYDSKKKGKNCICSFG